MSESNTNGTSTTAELPRDLASAQGMVNVQIDGQWHQVPKGTRMIEACRMAGVEVPHYCYHPKLSSPGNCRMCLVQMGMPPRLAPGQEPTFGQDGYQEIGWMPRPVIACANTVAENMGIRTTGELVEGCRNGVMEFLLINHPLDCPICDQAGECRLQEFSVEHGRGLSRFHDMKVKKPKNVDIGERIRLDDERCILCSRCIRFMDEVAEEPTLGFAQRGSHTYLTCHPGKRLDSNYSLNTVDLCPVGALTSNDFRFQMRVWFLKETKTIDVNCGTGCNVTVWTRGNEIYRITPRRNDEVNSEWMPDSHRLAFNDFQNDRRLTQALVRAERGGSHEGVSYREALAQVVTALEGRNAAEIGILASARMTNEELFLVKKLAEELGCQDRLAVVPRVEEGDGLLISADRNPNTTGAKLVWATDDPAEQLDHLRESVASGAVKVLLALHEEVFQAGFSEEGLKGLDCLVHLGLTAGPTAKVADVVVPAASFAEKTGSMINVTGRLQKLQRAMQPIGEAKDDWELLRDLLAVHNEEFAALNKIEDVFNLMGREISTLEDYTLRRIGSLGVQVMETGVTIPLIEKERGRIERGEIVG